MARKTLAKKTSPAAITLTQPEWQDLYEAVYSLNSVREVFNATASDQFEGYAVAGVLRPVSDVLWDFVHALERRFEQSAAGA